MTDPSITIDDHAWQSFPSDGDDGTSVLLATIVVNGCPIHLAAHAVRFVKDDGVNDDVPAEPGDPSIQLNDGEDSDFEALHAAFECDEPLQTVTIRGRQYVLFAHAYGD